MSNTKDLRARLEAESRFSGDRLVPLNADDIQALLSCIDASERLVTCPYAKADTCQGGERMSDGLCLTCWRRPRNDQAVVQSGLAAAERRGAERHREFVLQLCAQSENKTVKALEELLRAIPLAPDTSDTTDTKEG